MSRSPRLRFVPRTLAPGRSRGALLWALFAAVLALGGCSDPSGGNGSVPIAEVALADAEGEFLIATDVNGRLWLLRMDLGDEKEVQFRLRGPNGVPIENVQAYSVDVGIADTQIATWTSTGDRSGVFSTLKRGATTLRILVSKDDHVVFTSGTVALEVR